VEYECDFLEPGCYGWTIWDGSDVDRPAACGIWLVFGILQFKRGEFVSGCSYYEGAGDFLVLCGCVLETKFAWRAEFSSPLDRITST
jgi:hypothetical protein